MESRCAVHRAEGASHHVHLSFGADYAPQGTRFRLWAPGIASVVLVLDVDSASPRYISMEARPDGSHEGHAPVAPGTRYQYLLPGDRLIPDPASRAQWEDADGPSLVVDPKAYRWSDRLWGGRPWPEVVIYELHVGSFTVHSPGQGLRTACEQLGRLARLGITAVELMPVADFPGRWNWGYDGVLPYAPDRSYGTPDDLKAFVDTAHDHGLMVFMDVVYNHFGPHACFLGEHAPDAFVVGADTPWGTALALEGAASFLRTLLLENAGYWLEEFQMDGLRLDAPQYIHDHGLPHFLTELNDRIRRLSPRPIHLMLEHAPAPPAPALPVGYAARWHDPLHHAAHVLLTGERGGYYAPYARTPVRALVRALEAAGDPATAIVFLHNHDQIGNRPHGDRILRQAPKARLQALLALLLLAPFRPLLFMGEEADATAPFPFFCDFPEPLAQAVAIGRRAEFAAFPDFSGDMTAPGAEAAFRDARLLWPAAHGHSWHDYYQSLLTLRARVIVPHLPGAGSAQGTQFYGEEAFSLYFPVTAGKLWLHANLGDCAACLPPIAAGAVLYRSDGIAWPTALAVTSLPAWSILWVLEPGAVNERRP